MVCKVKDLKTNKEVRWYSAPLYTQANQTLSDIQTIRDDISDPDWQPLANNVRTKPPENTVFVVIDVRDKQGAIFVHESGTDEYVGGVGTDEQGNVVMIPWNHNWYYYTIGALQI